MQRNIKGQVAVEFMLVLPFFIGLFVLAFELALLMTKGELLTLAWFRGARTFEVRVVNGSPDSGAIQGATRAATHPNALAMPNVSSNLPGPNNWQRPQGSFRVTSAYTPLTAHGISGLTMQSSQNVVLQNQYGRHPLEDNCLPGWGIPCAR
jgi:Flp pilus assembly protein TadG